MVREAVVCTQASPPTHHPNQASYKLSSWLALGRGIGWGVTVEGSVVGAGAGVAAPEVGLLGGYFTI